MLAVPWVALVSLGEGPVSRDVALFNVASCKKLLNFRPESKQDYPPNLSILISGGKENNCDALSNGE